MINKLPKQLVAGDTLSFNLQLDYDPAIWQLTYTFINSDNKYTISSSADGNEFAINAAMNQTAQWKPGAYRWRLTISDDVQRITLDEGFINIKPNFENQSSYDARSHVQKVLDAIEAAIEKNATKTQLSYSIAGRSLSRYSHEELINLREKYIQYANQEKSQEEINSGRKGRKKILTRFVNNA